MPASLFLKKFTLSDDAPRKGFCVVTAGTYDGSQGVRLPAAELQPVSYKRPRKQGWTHEYEGDGLLIQHWAETPDIFGYTVSLTVTTRKDKALEIAGKSTNIASSIASGVGLQPVGAALSATEPLLKAIGSMSGVKTIASVQGSETDESGTKTSWTITREEQSVTFVLAYKVH